MNTLVRISELEKSAVISASCSKGLDSVSHRKYSFSAGSAASSFAFPVFSHGPGTEKLSAETRARSKKTNEVMPVHANGCDVTAWRYSLYAPLLTTSPPYTIAYIRPCYRWWRCVKPIFWWADVTMGSGGGGGGDGLGLLWPRRVRKERTSC